MSGLPAKPRQGSCFPSSETQSPLRGLQGPTWSRPHRLSPPAHPSPATLASSPCRQGSRCAPHLRAFVWPSLCLEQSSLRCCRAKLSLPIMSLCRRCLVLKLPYLLISLSCPQQPPSPSPRRHHLLAYFTYFSPPRIYASGGQESLSPWFTNVSLTLRKCLYHCRHSAHFW